MHFPSIGVALRAGVGVAGTGGSPAPAPYAERVSEQPLLPETTQDEGDQGWGEAPVPREDDDRILRERPPHYGG